MDKSKTDQATLDQLGESIAKRKTQDTFDRMYNDAQKEKEYIRRSNEAAEKIRKEVFTKDNQPAGELKKLND